MSEVLASSCGGTLPATTRRGFARSLAASPLATFSMPAALHARSLFETLTIALVGVGGRGADNHKVTNGSIDDPFIDREYRPGWAL
jgi:hypothetical protein